MAKGGDIIEITFNHSVIGSGTFFPKAAEPGTYDLGGYRSKDDANSIDGSGASIDVMNRVRGFFETTIANDMNIAKDAEKIAELAASPIEATWTFTVINGITYSGDGKPVGDIIPDIDKGTLKIKVAGSKFKQV